MRSTFSLTTLFIFLLLNIISLTTYAQQSSHTAGQVIIASGAFQALQTGQPPRVLQRGAYFYSGDTLMTGTDSSAQVRFTDGTVMALNPNSKVKVDDYVYQKNAKTDHSVITLIKGGFRALTGLISKENPNAYKVQTPVAVIGVRGTNYGVVLDKGQVFAGVWKGGIYLKNDKGIIEIGEGQDYNFATVTSANTAPIGLLNPPQQLVGVCGFNH